MFGTKQMSSAVSYLTSHGVGPEVADAALREAERLGDADHPDSLAGLDKWVVTCSNGIYRIEARNLPVAQDTTPLMSKYRIKHYTFFQPDGTSFSLTARDAFEAKTIELAYLGKPANASLCRYSADVTEPAKIKAALRKSARMYGDAR